MPYESNSDLPSRVRNHLPPHAQDIFRAAFNSAWISHSGDIDQEEIANRIAWSAVKKVYRKTIDGWTPK